MPDFRILIVDDQHEVRRMLHAGMQTLGPRFETLAIPSGEEALLEAVRKPIDLLVADVRLPGITGLELMHKFKKRNPELKVILITGMTDSRIRKQVAEAGANAFFIKPIDMADFLDAVERSLGVVKSILPEAPILREPEKPKFDLAGRITNLRLETQARTIALLDERGEILAQAGDPLNGGIDELLIPSLVSALSANAKVSLHLGKKIPESLLAYRGSRFDLALAPVGFTHALLILAQPGSEDGYPGNLGKYVFPAVREILAGLSPEDVFPAEEPFVEELPVSASSGEIALPDILPVDKEMSTGVDEGIPTPIVTGGEQITGEAALLEGVPEIDALFNRAPDNKLNSDDLDNFWETAAEQQENKSSRASALTYEEARRLGLAPDENRQ